MFRHFIGGAIIRRFGCKFRMFEEATPFTLFALFALFALLACPQPAKAAWIHRIRAYCHTFIMTYDISFGSCQSPPLCVKPAIAADECFNTSSDAAFVFRVCDARNESARNTSLVVVVVRVCVDARSDNDPKTMIFVWSTILSIILQRQRPIPK